LLRRAVANPLADLRGGLVLGGDALWEKVRKLLSGQRGHEALHWKKRDDAEITAKKAAALIAGEPDQRVRTWARLRLGGERLSDLARELGYADGSGVHQVARRLEAAAARDRSLHNQLNRLRKAMVYDVRS